MINPFAPRPGEGAFVGMFMSHALGSLFTFLGLVCLIATIAILALGGSFTGVVFDIVGGVYVANTYTPKPREPSHR